MTRLLRLLAPLLVWPLLAGCPDQILEVYDVCLLTGDPQPAAAFPGDVVVLSGGPMSAAFDTLVRVGGVEATIDTIDREGCLDCDSCRAAEDCRTCGECEDCTSECEDCVETLRFVVPDAPPGAAPIVVFNQHGTSAAIPFTVLGESPDTDDSDTGDTDDSDTDTDSDTDDTDTGDPDTDDSDTDTGDPDTDDSDTDTDDSDTDDSDTDTGDPDTDDSDTDTDTD